MAASLISIVALLILDVCRAVVVDITPLNKYIQDSHNSLRLREGAADMKYMTYEPSLELRARDWAERCGFYHQMRGFGENLAFFSSTGPPIPPSYVVSESMRNWYNEKPMYNFGQQSCGSACHYTQMVWARTSQVGCAMSYCGELRDQNGRVYRNAMYFVCFYSPQGNFVGQIPFTPGQPCSRCPVGDVCISGLCLSRGFGRRRRSVNNNYKELMTKSLSSQTAVKSSSK